MTPVRPRWARIAAFASSVATTTVALLGAAGVLPAGPTPAAAARVAAAPAPEVGAVPVTLTGASSPLGMRLPQLPDSRRSVVPGDRLPADSGSGRRVVFDQSAQRVWLVGEGNRVARTYLVSGSLTDNLKPGTYEVYSTSRDAIGIDDSGTMKFMVRFAHGERAAIGFHDIPVHNGKLVQTKNELGTPQSHGCIRQLRKDARALWDFAPVGTTVVVVA